MNKHIKLNKNNFIQLQSFKLILSLQLFILCSKYSCAAVNDYVFSSSVGNYLPINDSVLFSGMWDDENSALIALPFTFMYDSNEFHSVSISSNGFITLGALTSTVYCGLQASGPNSIAAYGTDLMGNSGSTVQFGTRGISPNREFIIQWSNCAHYQSTVDHYSFQIILHEYNNIIDVVYGPFIVQTTMGTNNCSDNITESGNVGLKGSLNSDINIRKITNGINSWDSSVTGSTINAVCNLSPINFPAEGLRYRWSPLSALAMHIVSCSTNIINDKSLNVQGTLNNPMAKLILTTEGNLAPIKVDSILFLTTGSNASFDLNEANIYYTGSSDFFTPVNRFGYTVSDPEGSRYVNGETILQEGINYFWLTYDVSASAVDNDTISGCFQVIEAHSSYISQTVPLNCTLGYHLVGGPVLNLTVLLQSLYNGNKSMIAYADPINFPMLCDTIIVELHHSTYPFSEAYSVSGIIDIFGNGQFIFPHDVFAHSYYIVVRHRNSLPAWSKDPVLFDAAEINFDFTVHH